MTLRETSIKLLYEWVKSESLRKHCHSVAASMEGYAKKLNLSDNEIDNWYICGLLHDFDYEKYPDINLHPKEGCKVLKELGYSNEIIDAILGHNEKTGVKRESLMAKTLFAIDELSGLIVALAKVRPGNFQGMSAKSVRKVMKKKDFAAAINREDILQGMKDLGIESDEDKNEHFMTVINSLNASKHNFGFDSI